MPPITPKRFAIILVTYTIVYAVGTFLLKPGTAQNAFGNLGQCLIQAVIVVTMGMNVRRSRKHGNAFWLLMSLGCLLWFFARVTWTYYETYLGVQISDAYIGGVLFFLHGVPIIAATTIQPHAEMPQCDRQLRLGYVDFALLLAWWIFLYGYVVGPWQFVAKDDLTFGFRYDFLYAIESLLVVAAFAVLWIRTAFSWKRIYGHLLAASLLYAFEALLINITIDHKSYHTGSLYDVPLIASMAWYAYAGFLASRSRLEQEPAVLSLQVQTYWHSRFSALALFSMPIFALFAAIDSGVGPAIQRYRVLLTLVSMLVLIVLLSLKQDMLQRKLIGLLRESRDSYENLQRIQGSLVQAEKLASIGRLVAGAAHEINNPLTAILGYSDLLADDDSAAADQRQIADKIRGQARRTKTLVSSLLTFAKQSPMQRSLLDMNAVVINALQLRELDAVCKDIETVRDLQPQLPEILGDPNHLLQMCFHILNNAVEAMQEAHGKGTLTVSTRHEGDRIVFRCADSGPGIASPKNIFDPFYTTKALGKGTGLGLSACYGIVHDHGGQISCENRPTGGALFTVSFPVAIKKPTPETSTAAVV
ncbi:MAG: periplasmic sensor signal transduction histidine kinase [Candidatus Angelobacter sp.]|jgi:signal transduction histidine kinase|nr:periplasmic sensor signal transduction histidine kinase [Candidatus Angelobacter sp.]